MIQHDDIPICVSGFMNFMVAEKKLIDPLDFYVLTMQHRDDYPALMNAMMEVAIEEAKMNGVSPSRLREAAQLLQVCLDILSAFDDAPGGV